MCGLRNNGTELTEFWGGKVMDDSFSGIKCTSRWYSRLIHTCCHCLRRIYLFVHWTDSSAVTRSLINTLVAHSDVLTDEVLSMNGARQTTFVLINTEHQGTEILKYQRAIPWPTVPRPWKRRLIPYPEEHETTALPPTGTLPYSLTNTHIHTIIFHCHDTNRHGKLWQEMGGSYYRSMI